MTGKYTPGPWQHDSTTLQICRLLVSTEEVNCEQISPSDSTEHAIAYVPTDFSTDEQMANARLIAAAPELASQLYWIVQMAKQEHWDINNSGQPCIPIRDWLELAEAALKKAGLL